MSSQTAYLIIFGLVGLIGYGVSKENVQNGALVAAIAGLALAAFVGGTDGPKEQEQPAQQAFRGRRHLRTPFLSLFLFIDFRPRPCSRS